ncbi:MAG: hypothetical protein CMQ03_06215 [Gammaproteobacteria bacterium]|nr:hypothetical protein [Gammaproteobacteria bacterium]
MLSLSYFSIEMRSGSNPNRWPGDAVPTGITALKTAEYIEQFTGLKCGFLGLFLIPRDLYNNSTARLKNLPPGTTGAPYK